MNGSIKFANSLNLTDERIPRISNARLMSPNDSTPQFHRKKVIHHDPLSPFLGLVRSFFSDRHHRGQHVAPHLCRRHNALHPEGRNQQGEGRRDRHQSPDFAAAATQLGVSEEALKTALGVPETPPELDENGRPVGDPPPRPDFAAAAAQLGVSETDLHNALHPEGRSPR